MCRVLNKHHAACRRAPSMLGAAASGAIQSGRDGDRASVIAKYECWLADQHHLLRALDELRGHDLVCWCAPLACHGDLAPPRQCHARRAHRVVARHEGRRVRARGLP